MLGPAVARAAGRTRQAAVACGLNRGAPSPQQDAPGWQRYSVYWREGVPIGMLRVGGDTLSYRDAAAEEEEGYQLPR